ncbi:MAG: hypothetical protein JST49_05840 [Bacteroidetes bacterium]|nr:hypothetical protein [Bacteroidota bacterium]
MSKRKKEVDLLEGGVITEGAMEAYIGGTLTAEERTQFEKLLAEDPFAQDALEGMQAAPNRTEALTRIANIKKKVRSQTGIREGKTVNIHWANYVWAAVVLGMLVGVGFLMVTYLNKHAGTDGEIAKTEAPQQEIVQADDNAVPKAPEATVQPQGESATGAEQPTAVGNANGTVTINSDVTLNPTSATTSTDTITWGNKEGFSMNNYSTTTNVGAGNNLPPSAKNRKDNAATNNTATTAQYDKAVTKEEASKTKRAEPVKADVAESDAVRTNAKPAAEKKITEVKDTKAASGGKTNVPTQAEAMKNFNAGDYKTSAEQFDAILKNQPNNADAQYFGGVSDYLNGNLNKSEKQFDKLLKSGDRYLEGSKWYKANILIKKGKTSDAKKILNELSNTNNPYKERATNKLKEL